MKLQKNSITAALLIAGVASLYTPKAEAFSLVETFRGWFGSSKAEQKVEKDVPSVRAKVTPTTSTTRAAATKIAIPAYKPTTPAVSREFLGYVDHMGVFKELSTDNLKEARILFVPQESGEGFVATADSSAVFTVKDNTVVGFIPSENRFVFLKKDETNNAIKGEIAYSGPMPGVAASGPMPGIEGSQDAVASGPMPGAPSSLSIRASGPMPGFANPQDFISSGPMPGKSFDSLESGPMPGFQ